MEAILPWCVMLGQEEDMDVRRSQLLDTYLIDNEDILARTRSLRTARRVWMRCARCKDTWVLI